MRTFYLRKLLLLLCLLGAGILPAAATHLMGGEMTYRYLDANGPATAPFRYEITVTVYTDQAGTSPRTVAEVAIYNKSSGNARIPVTTVNGPVQITGTLAIPRVSGPILIKPSSPGGCTPPAGTVNVLLNKYRATINLPLSFDGYYAVFTDNARNLTVTNLLNPGSTPMTLYSELAPPLIPNQSPIFSDTAIATICQGDTSLVLNNAFDADGDRLIYSFGTPSGQNFPASFTPPPTPVTYAGNYSVVKPFGNFPNSSASLNASTGLATYFAPNAGQYVVAVDVREYRTINGVEVLVGITRRDLQLVTRVCPPNVAPQFTPVTVAQQSYTIEEGQSLTFPVFASDPDLGTLSLKATSVLLDGAGGINASLGGQQGTLAGSLGSVTLNGTNGSVGGQFSFTPACGMGRATPYDVAVIVTDCGGKSVAGVFQIFVTRPAPPTSISGDNSICDRSQARTYTVSGSTPTGSYLWNVVGGAIQGSNTGNSIQVLWGSAVTQARVTVRNVSSFGCQSDSVSRIVELRPTATLAITASASSICPGQSATLNVTGGTTYTWTAGTQTFTGASITVSPTQTTTYTVTSSDGTCTATSQVTVTVNQAAVANAGAAQTYCIGTTAPQIGTAALAGYTYSWSPATGLSSTTVAQPTVTLTTAQTVTYTVTATSPQGCTATSQVTVTANNAVAAVANPNGPTSTAAVAFCSGASAQLGYAPAVVSGATYSWSPATGLSTTTGATPTITLTNTGTAPITQAYTLTATSTSGCVSTAQVTVTVNPAAVANAGTNQSFCTGATAPQIGTAALTGYTYSWSPATGLSSTTVAQPTITLTNTGATPITQTYTVTATTAQGCTATSQVTVTVNPTVAAVANPNGATSTDSVKFCSGGTASLGLASSVVPGATYSWSPATGLSSTSSATPTVTLTNTGSTQIIRSYTLTATTPAAVGGCATTSTVIVVVNPAAVANAGTNRSFCTGATAPQIGTAGLPGYSYSWSPAAGLSSTTAAQPTITLTNSGATPITQTYTVTATTAQGCSATSQVTVTVNPTVASVANPNGATSTTPVTICSGASAQLGLASSVVPGATYSWSPATGLSSATSATPTITLTNTGTAPITQTYTLTASAAAALGGCPTTSQVTVVVNPAAIANAGTATAICSGASAQLGTAALTGYTYSWSPATGLSSATAAQPTVTLPNTGTTPITQTYTLTATTAQGCSATSQVTVTVNPAVIVNAGAAAAYCSGKSVRLGTAALTGYTYSWSPATGLSSATAAQPTVTLPNTGTTPITQTYTLTATTAQGCSATSQVTVTVNPRPGQDNIQGSASVCPQVTGVAYSIVNPTNTAYQWLITGGTIVSGQGTPAVTVNWGAASTTAVLKAFQLNSFGCSSDTAQFPVQINQLLATPTPRPVNNGPTTVCAGDIATYETQYTNGSSYSWQITGGTQLSTNLATVTVRWDTPGTASIIVTETSQPSGGSVRCLGTSAPLSITVRPTPTSLPITGPNRICAGNAPTYTIAGGTGSTYQWTLNGPAIPGAQGNSVTLPSLTAGIYTLTARETNAQGCQGPVNTISFTVDAVPAVVSISGPVNVCADGPNSLNNIAYSVSGQPGSTFQWTVVGGTIVSGQGTGAIVVNFTPGAPNRTVSVTETSQFGCPGALASRQVALDNSSVALNTASVDLQDDRKINLSLNVPNAASNPANQVRVMRRVAGTGSFVQVATTPNTGTTFSDNTVDADANSYDYRLDLLSLCGNLLSSTLHTTIRTEVAVSAQGTGRAQDKVTVKWNAYVGFAVKEYQLYRQADGNAQALIATIPAGSPLTYELATSAAGFNQGFRVKAISTDAQPREAWSNLASIAFDNKLEFYNVITPNGDGLNDQFYIKNVELYAGNSIAIFNKWGREVYKTDNYRNTWGADGQPAGTYYFLFKQANGTVTKGWFEVVR